MIAQILLFIYLGLTFCSTLALKLAGMNWFDALTQAMSAVATSGFSTKERQHRVFRQRGRGIDPDRDDVAGQYPFRRAFRYIDGTPEQYFPFGGDAVVSFDRGRRDGRRGRQPLFRRVYDTVAGALRYAAFQVVSLISTAGFATADTTVWPATAIVLLISVSIVCGCAGSTTGGIKTDRFLLAIKTLRLRFSLQQHPNAVVRVRIDGNVLNDKIASIRRWCSSWPIFWRCSRERSWVRCAEWIWRRVSLVGGGLYGKRGAWIRHGRLAGQLLRPAGRDEVFEYDVDVAGSFGDFRTRAVVFSKMVEMMRKAIFPFGGVGRSGCRRSLGAGGDGAYRGTGRQCGVYGDAARRGVVAGARGFGDDGRQPGASTAARRSGAAGGLFGRDSAVRGAALFDPHRTGAADRSDQYGRTGLGAGESRPEQSVDDDGRPWRHSPARFVADGRSGAQRLFPRTASAGRLSGTAECAAQRAHGIRPGGSLCGELRSDRRVEDLLRHDHGRDAGRRAVRTLPYLAIAQPLLVRFAATGVGRGLRQQELRLRLRARQVGDATTCSPRRRSSWPACGSRWPPSGDVTMPTN